MNPSPLPWVLLHGWGMHPNLWTDFPAWPLDHQADPPNTLPLALPGHDGQPLPAAAQDLASWAERMLDQAPPRALWVGWSLGALVALAAARRAPERVGALVLLAATPCFVIRPDWPDAMPAATLDAFAVALRSDPEAQHARFLALQTQGGTGARETLRRLRQRLASAPAPDPQALAAGLRLLRDSDLRDWLPDLPQPTLWLFGDADPLIPSACASRIAALMPHAQIARIADAAHVPHLSHPVETGRQLARFSPAFPPGGTRAP